MKKSFRKIFFWTFLILFFISTPLAVFYSLGYRFDFYQKIFVHSGSITVKSTPTGISVFIDGKQQTGSSLDIINNSTTVGGLRPGKYNLRITADGYSTWEKNVEVHSGISAEFWNVFLVPYDIGAKEINSQGAKRFFISPFNQKIAYTKENENGVEIWLEDLQNEKNARLFSEKDVKFSSDELENSEWNIKEKLILNPVLKNGKKDFLILDVEQQEEPVYLSRETSLENPDKARWSPREEKGVYFLTGGAGENLKKLYFFKLDTREKALVAENIRTFDISSNHLYFLAENNILYRTNLDGSGKEQIMASLFFSKDAGEDPRLIAYDDDRQALVTGGGDLIVRNNGKEDFLENIANGVKSVQFSDDGKKLLYWSDNEIDVFFLRDWDVQPRRQENEIQQIVRFSSPVKNVFWYRDYEHIFFSSAGKIKMIELDPRDRRICFDILDYNSENFTSSYDSYNGVYYFLGEAGGSGNISYFDMPEKKSIFGR